MGLVPKVVQVEFVHEAFDSRWTLPPCWPLAMPVTHSPEVDALEAEPMGEPEELASPSSF